MAVRWEVEYPGMQLHENEVVWTMKNVGDEAAQAGSHCGDISIWQHPGSAGSHVDTTPWTNPLSVDREVHPEAAHTMTFPLQWTGQQHGTYTAAITLGEGVSSEIYFEVTLYGIAPGYG
jgi:hypothetical protein